MLTPATLRQSGPYMAILGTSAVVGIMFVVVFPQAPRFSEFIGDICVSTLPPASCTKILTPENLFYYVVVTLGLLPLVWLAECMIPADPRQPVFSVGLAHDFIWYLTFPLFRIAVVGAYTAWLYSICDSYLAFLKVDSLVRLPLLAQILFVVLAQDFLAWFHHLVRHKIPMLWQFHKVHHSVRELNYFTDIRNHPVDFLAARTIQFLPFYSLSLDVALPTFIAWEVFRTWITKLYHANIRTNFGMARWILVTPQSHRIHHSRNPAHFDHNFGVIFSFWDRIFRTQYNGVEEYPCTGVEDEFPVEQSLSWKSLVLTPVRQTIYPIKVLLRECFRRAGSAVKKTR